MEDNNDMPSASTSQTQLIGETGKEISDLMAPWAKIDIKMCHLIVAGGSIF